MLLPDVPNSHKFFFSASILLPVSPSLNFHSARLSPTHLLDVCYSSRHRLRARKLRILAALFCLLTTRLLQIFHHLLLVLICAEFGYIVLLPVDIFFDHCFPSPVFTNPKPRYVSIHFRSLRTYLHLPLSTWGGDIYPLYKIPTLSLPRTPDTPRLATLFSFSGSSPISTIEPT